jgi:hypothetical protein
VDVAGHSLEPGLNLGESDLISRRALPRIVYGLIVNEGNADTPIGTVVILALIGIDEVTLTKPPDLMSTISSTRSVRSDLLTGFADEKSGVAFRDRLEA